MTSTKTFEGPFVTDRSPEGMALRDQQDIETLTRQGHQIAAEQDCTSCKLRTVCSDTDGKRRVRPVCEADFW